MGLLVSTRAAVLGCSTGEADRTYLMLRAAFRSLKGTLRMGRSPRMMAGTSPRFGRCSTGGRPRAGICGLIAILSMNRTSRIPKKMAPVWRPRRKRCQRLPLGSWTSKERWLSGTGVGWVLDSIVESCGASFRVRVLTAGCAMVGIGVKTGCRIALAGLECILHSTDCIPDRPNFSGSPTARPCGRRSLRRRNRPISECPTIRPERVGRFPQRRLWTTLRVSFVHETSLVGRDYARSTRMKRMRRQLLPLVALAELRSPTTLRHGYRGIDGDAHSELRQGRRFGQVSRFANTVPQWASARVLQVMMRPLGRVTWARRTKNEPTPSRSKTRISSSMTFLCEWAYSWPEAGEMPLTADEVLETLVEYERNRSTPGVPSMFCISA